MSLVFVVDQQHRPCRPVHPGRARHLLKCGRAAVSHRFPFTSRLKAGEPSAEPEPLRLKLDPGSQTTGLAVVNDASGQVVWSAELTQRGQQLTARLDQRRACRRSRRSRHTRSRPPRFLNRRRRDGWLPPSLASRSSHTLTWVTRLRRWGPLGALSLELVKFDTQLLQHAEIAGVAYQQGEVAGYEMRKYVLEKWGRQCAYCQATNVPLQIEHLVPKARDGSQRVSTLACQPCHDAKGQRTAAECGHPERQAQAKAPLRDAAAVNATRWALSHRLNATGLPLETGTGGRTKWHRTTRELPKTHWLDAVCVGASSPKRLAVRGVAPLLITAMGRYRRQMGRTNPSGFPDKKAKAISVVGGLRTGDLVRAVVPASRVKAGTPVRRLAIRATGSGNVKTPQRLIEGIHVRYCQPLQRGDGYSYHQTGGAALPPQG